jgi:hypothetical protein
VSDNGHDDENVTPVTTPIANGANREMATAVANLLVESQTHTSVLKELYRTLCVMAGVAPRSWRVDLIEEYERHQKKTGANLLGLRIVAGR